MLPDPALGSLSLPLELPEKPGLMKKDSSQSRSRLSFGAPAIFQPTSTFLRFAFFHSNGLKLKLLSLKRLSNSNSDESREELKSEKSTSKW